MGDVWRKRDGTPVGWGGPARGYSWKQFENGNLVPLVHGGYSNKVIQARAGEIYNTLVEMYPMALNFPPMLIERYALNEARTFLLYERFFDLLSSHADEAYAEKLNSEISKCERVGLDLLQALGLTMVAWSAVAKNFGYVRHLEADRVGALREEGAALRRGEVIDERVRS